MVLPFEYTQINSLTATGPQPSVIHINNTALYHYFRRQYLLKALSVFRFNLPEWWNNTLFLYALFGAGYVAVINTDLYGIVPQPCTLYGQGVQYEPTRALIANPVLDREYDLIIGRQCAVVHMSPDYGGLMDTVNFYARETAAAIEALEINLLNSKLSYVFGAEDKKAAETLKKVFDRINGGELAAFTDTRLVNDQGKPAWTLFSQDVGKNFIAPEVLEIVRRMEAAFCNAVGIPANLAQTKKERVITAEVEANDTETRAAPSLWLDTIREGLSVVQRLYGLNVTVDWRFTP